jgi:hypothetical protein
LNRLEKGIEREEIDFALSRVDDEGDIGNADCSL